MSKFLRYEACSDLVLFLNNRGNISLLLLISAAFKFFFCFFEKFAKSMCIAVLKQPKHVIFNGLLFFLPKKHALFWVDKVLRRFKKLDEKEKLLDPQVK